jgi:hypothetical protein
MKPASYRDYKSLGRKTLVSSQGLIRRLPLGVLLRPQPSQRKGTLRKFRASLQD